MLAAKSENMLPLERKLEHKVVLLFDGMATREELEYNSADDVVYGFEDEMMYDQLKEQKLTQFLWFVDSIRTIDKLLGMWWDLPKQLS